jgi:hypothetical protein
MNKPCQHITVTLPLQMISKTFCQDAQLDSSVLRDLLRLTPSIHHQLVMEIAQLVHIVLKRIATEML